MGCKSFVLHGTHFLVAISKAKKLIKKLKKKTSVMNGEMKVATRVPLLAVQNVADVVSDEIPG